MSERNEKINSKLQITDSKLQNCQRFLEFEIWNSRDLLIDPNQIEQEQIRKRGLTMAPKTARGAAVTGIHISF